MGLKIGVHIRQKLGRGGVGVRRLKVLGIGESRNMI